MATADTQQGPATRPLHPTGAPPLRLSNPHTTELPLPDESLSARVLQEGYSSLRFPEPLERQYRDDHRANTYRLVRMAVIVSFITSAGFALIDHWVIRATNETPDIVRFGMQFPVMVACLLATSRRFYFRWYERAIMFGLPLFGIGTVIMTSYAPPSSTAMVGARLILVAFFCYFMLGLRFRSALICNGIVFAALLLACAMTLLPINIGLYLAFALLCANFIGAVGAYALEHASRTAFLERLSLEEMAARDGLTRLLNRQTFEFRARNAWRTAAALQRPIAVLMIDVDYFKRFNDCYGHQAGDECLRKIAATVREAITPSHDELVARYGGEELIALLVDRQPNEVEKIARRVVDKVAALAIPHTASIAHEHVTVSVGATLPIADDAVAFSAIANTADQALYSAKHQGRNNCVILAVQAPEEVERDRSNEGVTRPEARALLEQEGEALSGAAAG